MRHSIVEAAFVISLLSLSACAQLAGLDMRKVDIGMTREQAIATMPGKPTTYTLKNGPVEYVLLSSVKSFTAMYSDYPNTITFIRLENGKVVDRGLVDASEEVRVRQISPAFVLRDWQAKGGVRPYVPDKP